MIGQFLSSEPKLKGILPVFDSKKNIYTACPIPGLQSKVSLSIKSPEFLILIIFYFQVDIKFQFKESDRDPPRVSEFTISLQPTGELEIDLRALASYCKGGASTDIPLRPIQALDIALKYGAAQK